MSERDLDDHDLLVRIDERVGKMSETLDGHSPRIRKLEQFRSYCVGCMGIIVVMIGWLRHGGS